MLSIERSMIVIIYVIKSYSLHDAARKEKKVKFPLKTSLETFLRELNVIACRTGLLFFHFPGERRQTPGVSEGRSIFFSGCFLRTCLASGSLRACFRSPEKGPSLSYAVVVLQIGWQTWSRVSTVSQQGNITQLLLRGIIWKYSQI